MSFLKIHLSKHNTCLPDISLTFLIPYQLSTMNHDLDRMDEKLADLEDEVDTPSGNPLLLSPVSDSLRAAILKQHEDVVSLT